MKEEKVRMLGRESHRAGGSSSVNDPGRAALAQVEALQLPVLAGGREQAMRRADGTRIHGWRLARQGRQEAPLRQIQPAQIATVQSASGSQAYWLTFPNYPSAGRTGEWACQMGAGLTCVFQGLIRQ